jgi:hypothetical protein
MLTSLIMMLGLCGAPTEPVLHLQIGEAVYVGPGGIRLSFTITHMGSRDVMLLRYGFDSCILEPSELIVNCADDYYDDEPCREYTTPHVQVLPLGPGESRTSAGTWPIRRSFWQGLGGNTWRFLDRRSSVRVARCERHLVRRTRPRGMRTGVVVNRDYVCRVQE